MTVTCPHCKQDSAHAEIYRGCMRPCPHCGELVSLATPEDAPVKRAPTEECWCGEARDERGLDFAVGYLQVTKPSLAVQLVPLVGLITGESRYAEREVEYYDGWACEDCTGRIRRLRAWFRRPWIVTPLLWLAGMVPLGLATKAKTAEAWGILALTWGIAVFLLVLPVVLFVCAIATGVLSEPLKKRFGKGKIVAVKILKP